MTEYDAIVVGAGQAGGPLAMALARAGWRTALIEREQVGGTCINRGCTPTKTVVASARVASIARTAARYGVRTGPVSVDLSAVRARKQAIVESFRTGSERRIGDTDGLDLVRGDASFTGPTALSIRSNGGPPRTLRAPRIFLNCGARPVRPDLPGLDTVPTLDSTSIMELGEVPEHLIVLGGGYIGLEFGQAFRRFGASVTIVQRGPRLLPLEDDDISAVVRDILVEDGIEVLLETQPVSVAPGVEGGITVVADGADGIRIVNGSHLLLATGRTPNTEGLGLEAAGVVRDARGFIVADEMLRTSAPGVFALGDVKGGPAFTHIAYDDYRVIRDTVLEGRPAGISGRPLPYTVFIDPQLGRIGMTEREARKRGIDIRIFTIPMGYVARAIEMDETRGFMKAIVDRATDRILGAAVLGVEGGEIMTMLQLAMAGGLTASTLRETIFSHPGLGEGLNTLFASEAEVARR